MSRPARPTNYEVADAFRELLTAGCPEEMRELTKAWRTELWRAFAEIDRRLCPFPRELLPPPRVKDDVLTDE